MLSAACSRAAFASSWAWSNCLAKVSMASTVNVFVGSTPGVGAVWHRAQMVSDVLLHGPCCCMQTLLAGASQPSCPVGDLQWANKPLQCLPVFTSLAYSTRTNNFKIPQKSYVMYLYLLYVSAKYQGNIYLFGGDI